ncbi:hypothetical protein SNK03_009648 [Fusarium graminearum]
MSFSRSKFDKWYDLYVVATFSAGGGDDCLGSLVEGPDVKPLSFDPPKALDMDMQMIVLYTVPFNLFAIMSEDRYSQECTIANQHETDGDLKMGEAPIKGSSSNFQFAHDASTGKTAHHMFEIRGQPVAQCHDVVELALDLGLDTVLWAFSAQGWTQAWNLHGGRGDTSSHVLVQPDGSLRHVDSDGDCIMTDGDQFFPTPNVTIELIANLEAIMSIKADATFQVPQERYCGPLNGRVSRI